MKESYSLMMALAAVFVSGAVIYGTRLLPFVADTAVAAAEKIRLR